MAYGTALKQGLRIAGRIDRKYNINKIFVQKYVPPGYRNKVNKIFDIVGALGGGYGIYQFVQSLYAPDSPGMSGIPEQRNGLKTSPSNKTRGRFSRSNRSRHRCYPYRNSGKGRTSTSKHFRSRNWF